MDYNEKVLNDARKVIIDRFIPAEIHNAEVGVKVVFSNGNTQFFTTPKLAKIYLENYKASDNVIIDRIESGVVSQKTDEVKPKRRGRKKKADNDRTSSV